MDDHPVLQDATRRLDRLERDQDRVQKSVTELIISTQRIGDLVQAQNQALPRLEAITSDIGVLKTEISNTKLVQRGFIWLAGIIGSSAVAMVMAFLFGSR